MCYAVHIDWVGLVINTCGYSAFKGRTMLDCSPLQKFNCTVMITFPNSWWLRFKLFVIQQIQTICDNLLFTVFFCMALNKGPSGVLGFLFTPFMYMYLLELYCIFNSAIIICKCLSLLFVNTGIFLCVCVCWHVVCDFFYQEVCKYFLDRDGAGSKLPPVHKV